jgi:hypothetical protein
MYIIYISNDKEISGIFRAVSEQNPISAPSTAMCPWRNTTFNSYYHTRRASWKMLFFSPLKKKSSEKFT